MERRSIPIPDQRMTKESKLQIQVSSSLPSMMHFFLVTVFTVSTKCFHLHADHREEEKAYTDVSGI
jgi:hypothetical protein